MKKTLFAALAFVMIMGVAIVLVPMPTFALTVFSSKTEQVFVDPDKAYPGYTMLAANNPFYGDLAKFYLLDNNGNVVKDWSYDGDLYWLRDVVIHDDGKMTARFNPLYSNGINLRKTQFLISGGLPHTGIKTVELDWDGNILRTIGHPKHKDMTVAEFVSVTGADPQKLSDADYVQSEFLKLPLAKRNQLRTYFDYYEHHAYKKIYNKALQKYTYLLVVNKHMSPTECYQAGANPAYSKAPGGPFTDAVKSDLVTEIDPDTGKVVWEWAFVDHLIQNYDSSKDNWYSNIAQKYYNGNVEEAFYRRLDVNAQLYQQGAHGPIPDWQHLNGVDYNAERGEIVISSRHTSEIYVIDHDKTFDAKDPYTLAASSLGDFKWRFGSPHNYASAEQLGVAGIKEKAPKPTLLDAQYGQMWGQHDAHWIQGGLSGAGQILLFDNGNGRPASAAFSAVLQINPYDNNGNYIKELSAGYKANLALLPNIGNQQNVGLPNGRIPLRPSNLITWSFVANDGNSMFSPYISGAQRLPNGNTLITVSQHNKYLEVTEKGQLVSEYISPKTTSGLIANTLFDGKGEPYYYGWDDNVWVTKFRRYPVTHPAFIGKILEPQGPITNRVDPYYLHTGFGFGSPNNAGGTGGATAGSGTGAGY